VSNQNDILRHSTNEILDYDSTHLRVIFRFKLHFEDLLLLIFRRYISLWSFAFFTVLR